MRYTIFSIVFRPFVLSYEYLEENVAPLIKFILLFVNVWMQTEGEIN